MVCNHEKLEEIEDPYRRCEDCSNAFRVLDISSPSNYTPYVICRIFGSIRELEAYPCSNHIFANSPETFFV